MKHFDWEKIHDCEFFQENRLPAHSDHVAYASEFELREGKSSLRMDLDGLWKFSYAKNMQQAVLDFEKDECDCHGWEDICVPAHIQMEGYDIPHYTNCNYPWDGKEEVAPGQAPREFNPVASYVKYFELPEHMKGKRIIVSFQGVESGFALWLNGVYVGYSENSFNPAEFELTGYIREGENKLAVRVFKWTSGSWCEDQDFFRFSGIYREVYLYAVPKTHLWDVKVETAMNEDFTQAKLQVAMKTTGVGSVTWKLTERRKPTTLENNRDLIGGVEVPCTPEEQQEVEQKVSLTGKNDVIWETDLGPAEVKCSFGACPVEESGFSGLVEQPKLWSAEQPNLYVLTLILKDEEGMVQEIVTQNVGFRQFELKDGLMLLNGKRIVFKGTNRHEFSSISGRVPNREEVIRDLETMKRNNINAIRTSHYPNASLLYELCDIYGIYLIAENNLESHGTMEAFFRQRVDRDFIIPLDKDEWMAVLLDRVNTCYQRDKNHASILIWSCGNESYGGKVIYEMSELFRRLDDKRLVHYEGIFHCRDYNATSDMESQMYPSAASIQKFLEEHPEKPFVCCEYTHAMGNSCGGMHKYTDLTETNPRYQGGFIWDYIDQSIYKKDRYGKEFLAYGGDFGDRPSDYNFSGNGIAYGGERRESPKMQEVKYNYQNISVIFEGEDAPKRPAPEREDGLTESTVSCAGCQEKVLDAYADAAFTVYNKNLFVNTSDYAASVTLLQDGVPVCTVPMEIAVDPLSQQRFEVPQEIVSYIAQTIYGYLGALLPEFAVTVSFALREDTLWAKAGHEVAFGQAVYSSKEDLVGAEHASVGKVPQMRTILGKQLVAYDYKKCRKPMLIRGYAGYGVKGEHFSALFSANGPGMVSYIYGGREMINDIPKPNFWRGPVDNDRGNQMPQRYAQWKIASMYLNKCEEPACEERENCIVITYRYVLPTTPMAECHLSYAVFGDGTVETTLTYDPVAELGDMPEFGVIMKLDAEYDTLRWYGLGEQETYADRKRGGRLGIYTNKVADNLAEYLRPQECGNKCGVRYAQVVDRKGRGMLFFGKDLSFHALPYTPHELENAAHAYELPQIHYTVVRVAETQMGVSGDDSWGAKTHPEYLVDVSGPKRFTFCFRGI